MNNNEKILNSKDWDFQWENIFDHYQQDMRHAFYINAILNPNDKEILELGAGSFRDIVMLNKLGISCSGIDYSDIAIKFAQEKYPDLKNKIIRDNIFKMNFKDNSFDLSYHNGLIGYYKNNDILSIFKEQARVSSKRIVATVHNKHNIGFFEYFEKLKKKDSLYDLRFFEVDEMQELLRDVCSNVVIIPVGKRKEYYEDYLIKIGLNDPKSIKKSFDYHGMDLLNESERLMCIGELKK
ncbi:MAG: class I SAM-dependent methyltransferase [Bacteroidales bacterium]|nr:class I SAM-dependent methyltransferase [Bacteroidales bacterium]